MLNEAMNEVEVQCVISMPDGPQVIQAFARSPNAELVCHPLDGVLLGDSAWVITHRATGTVVRPCRVYSKEEALALIDIYEPLAPWSEVRCAKIGDDVEFDDKEKWKRIRRSLEDAYDRFALLALS